jgi:RND superfamily putative drug exporter
MIVLVGLACSIPLFGRLSDGSVAAGTQAEQVQGLINRYGPNSGTDIVVLDGAPVARPGLSQQVRSAEARMLATPGVRSVQSCYDAGADCPTSSPLRATGGTASLMIVSFAQNSTGSPTANALDAVSAAAHTIRAARVLVGGDDYFGLEATSLAESDLIRGELLGLLVAFVVLVALFGLRAALIPLLSGLATFAGAFALLLIFTYVTPVDAYGVNIVTMLGLGLSLDYALLLLVRYRQARRTGQEHEAAVGEAVAKAGNTVRFSGVTVVLCLSVLVVFKDTPFTSIGLGGVAATVAAMAAALALVPALLRSWGTRMPLPRRSDPGEGFARLARRVQRRPGVTILLAVGALVFLASPALNTHLVEVGVDSLPSSAEARVALEVLDAHFPQYGIAQVDVVASVTPHSSNADRLVGRVEHLSGVRSVSQTPLGARTLLTTEVGGASNGPQAVRVVQDIRSLHTGYGILVGGAAAFQLDHEHQLAGRLALAIGLLVIVTALLIALLTGSWALALAAPLLAALSQGAMLGALVWAFQDGHLRHILPTASTGSIIIYVPIVAFALAYALSLDYLVFLFSRMREASQHGTDLNEAMAESLKHTGQVVTAAAGLIALVFLGFATGSLLLVQQLGFALVVAVVLDATLVRCVLLPAVVAVVASRAAPGRSKVGPDSGPGVGLSQRRTPKDPDNRTLV